MNEEKTIYILDTNILLHEPFAFLSFQEQQSNAYLLIFNKNNALGQWSILGEVA